MQWQIGGGRHEGKACAVVPDGRLSYDLGGLGVLVQGISGQYPRDTEKRDHEVVSDDDVIGWRASCRCGWAGKFWTRASTKSEENLDNYTAFAPFLGFATPPLSAEDAMKVEWLRHAETSTAVEELLAAQKALLASKSRLDNAVAKCRAIGLPWSTVASSLGITRQSAHAKWKRMDQ
ncbi:hypothetical protein [Paenarthrobacter aromaticivorans]|uniref:Uncharacterized protein n=1 Tax=Paenarthrobacter aromaticivorans TaxID=2849150 RepID=A0ABS6I827_9MICC|nr:hypothetical protein [Paenarthrobacter sp. MMS21-TAE1-1]MBU8867867.1 hypothetical protein [Paenarthrobacter sp. MMS21-TAE1-1]